MVVFSEDKLSLNRFFVFLLHIIILLVTLKDDAENDLPGVLFGRENSEVGFVTNTFCDTLP